MSALEQAAHDRVLAWCRAKPRGGMPVMRNPYGSTDCVVYDLYRTTLKPGSTWERTETELARGATWLDVAASLGLQGE
jgi:hypothetical protein